MTTQSPSKTLGYEATIGAGAPVGTSSEISTAATLAAPSRASPFSPPAGASRTTVLPRIEGEGAKVELIVDSLTRYEPMKLLGAGGMGEVVLVRDHDIARPVALKRLLPELRDPVLLARFVEEIRTVGRLEHPNIVPIHDVGVDELGRYFFVMKYVEGETLESVIEKLALGIPEYRERYTFEQRIEIFLGILHALEFAHDSGFVHRDIKPANVMIGRYGEVVLMDWGIAKPLASKRDAAAGATGEIAGAHESERSRMFATQVGALIGTPAYMAPEQARGENEKVDARSDLYSAAVLFHELVSLKHYLHGKPTMEAMIAAAATEEIGFLKLLSAHGKAQGAPPAELLHFCVKGLSKDPANRFQSASAMIHALQDILEGNVRVQCHITLTKRTARQFGRIVDKAPHLAFLGMLGLLAMLVFAGIQAIRMLIV
jgi:serine/threonine protein kinase